MHIFTRWAGLTTDRYTALYPEAGHTKAFGYPVAEHWGESRNVQFRRWDSNQQHISPESNVLPTEPPRFCQIEDHITPGPQQGGSSPNWGIVCKEQPRHEKAIPMGPAGGGRLTRRQARQAMHGLGPARGERSNPNWWITFDKCMHQLIR